jgi:hypothetical protein
MATYQERILFFVESITKGGEKLASSAKALQQFNFRLNKQGELLNANTKKLATTSDYVKGFTKNFESAEAIANLTNAEFKKLVDSGVKLKNVGANLSMRYRRFGADLSNLEERSMSFVRATTRHYETLDTARKSVDKLGYSAKQMRNIQGNFAEAMLESGGVTQLVSKNFDSFLGQLLASQDEFKNYKNIMGNATTTGGKFGQRLRFLTAGLEGFRMEMLGVAFFGAFLSSSLFNLVNPGLQLVGVFDLFSTTLEILFYPIGLLILEKVIIPLINFISSLSEETRLIIGAIVLFTGVLVLLLSTAGFLIIGIGSIIKSLEILSISADTTKAFLSGLFTGFIRIVVIAGLVIAAYQLISTAIDKLGKSSDDNKQKVEALGDGFNLFLNNILEPFKESWIDLGKVMTGVDLKTNSEVWVAFGQVMVNVFSYMLTGFGFFYTGLRLLWNTLTYFGSKIYQFVNYLVELISGSFADLAGYLGMEGLSKTLKHVQGTVKTMKDAFADNALKDIEDMNDAWKKQINLTEQLGKSIQSPSAAIDSYRAQQDKLAKSQDNFIKNNQVSSAESSFINNGATPKSAGIITPSYVTPDLTKNIPEVNYIKPEINNTLNIESIDINSMAKEVEKSFKVQKDSIMKEMSRLTKSNATG